ncbi:MAG: hydroxyacid dehydrogenase [Candidatus Omnitrophica bacterium]|nr:hydroxyacid dehydrogenase [Candidatus Omnitrophota bacterium]
MGIEKIKILLGPSTFAETDKSPLEKLASAGFEVIHNPYKRKLTEDELLKLLPGVVGLIAGLEPLNRKVLQASCLKVISRCGSGLSNVDLQAARDLGIIVRSTPSGPTTAVAELTLGCLLSLLRQIPPMNQSLHQGTWVKRIGRQLQGACVAVIGFGRIGRKVGQLLAAFGAKVVAVDPLLSGEVENIKIVPLSEALKKADIITLHASGEDRLLGSGEFEMMKEGVFILNVARGGLLDEKALAKAIDGKKVAGAWLDTFDVEPYSGILCRYEQVILTPHIGSYTVECRREMEMEAVLNLMDSFK